MTADAVDPRQSFGPLMVDYPALPSQLGGGSRLPVRIKLLKG